MKKYGLWAMLLACAAFCSSCNKSKTTLPYFTDIREVAYGTMEAGDFTPKIVPDDELYITVTSMAPSATVHYNLPAINPATNEVLLAQTTPRQQTYVVDSKGDIQFPQLGTIHVQGMTTTELQAYLTKEISKDVQDPVVTVRLVNFVVAVAGEVAKPGRQQVTSERYSVLDALSAAGDLTPYGERSNVLLVREENGERQFVHLNLNSSDILSSPYFYLKQNDYIYVEPNEIRQANARFNQDNSYKLSMTSTIVSATSVIASLVIALTVK